MHGIARQLATVTLKGLTQEKTISVQIPQGVYRTEREPYKQIWLTHELNLQ